MTQAHIHPPHSLENREPIVLALLPTCSMILDKPLFFSVGHSFFTHQMGSWGGQ